MLYEIDVDRLRRDLMDDYGSAMTSGFPMAVTDLSDVESMSDSELISFAERKGIDLDKYII